MSFLTRFTLALALSASVWAADLSQQAERYLEHVKHLASPEMRGRGAGMAELDRAAGYIVERFREHGVEPAGESGYLQPFTVTTGAEMGEDNRFIVETIEGNSELKPGDDYLPINFSGLGEVSGEVVFAGYGITADEKGYDDYFHLDVKDKIVIVMRYEPPSFVENEGEGRRRWTHHANLISKAINARNRGAKAVVLVNGESKDSKGDKLIKFGSVSGPENAGVVMVQAKNSVVERWLRRSGKSLRLLQRDINLRTQPQSFSLAGNFKVTLEVDIEREQATVNNVVGYLPGETDEYVVIGAHYDHLGLGDESSLAPDKIGQVHHGADDNASGTAGLIELARRFAAEPKRRRGALFIAFAGEEIGLLGSRHWVENPTRPLDNAAAMLNMDMIGRIDKEKVYVGGLGTAAVFDDLVDGVAEEAPFEVGASRSGYSASDHTSFTAKGVPVLFFFSGLHGDYHKPSDTWDKINAEAAVELLDVIAGITDDLRTREDRPEFIREEASAHGHGGDPSSSGGGGGYGPYFGSIPDFAEVPNGVRFADIRPGSPADKGGIKAGDILTGFGDKPIQNLYDFTYALRDSEVGQTVEIKLLRDGEEIVTKVTLEERQ